MPKRLYATLADRILANSVENPTRTWDGVPCRDWTGSVFPRSDWPDAPREQHYGRISLRYRAGPRKGKVKSTGAHRQAVKAFKPHLRVGTKNVVRHMCHRPICVEPHHLMGGIQKQNVRDAVKAGHHKTPFRRSKGERYAAKRAT
jgi:hypothetical protein